MRRVLVTREPDTDTPMLKYRTFKQRPFLIESTQKLVGDVNLL